MNQEMVDALSHPIRLEILETLRGRVASAAEISAEIGHSLGVVSYHANTLVEAGCLELVHSKAKRGGIENFFAITPRGFFNRPD
ncbi:MAG TPA: winged helix-turn-helix domain-containing protein [Solirubrobacterales bacterium]|nr:winged helix-turn-helix domain-containing protein [Solirubrobacterales bacterium]